MARSPLDIFVESNTLPRPDNSLVVACPECRMQFSHIQSVHTLIGHDRTEATDYGIAVRGMAPHQERRSCLVVRFRGECPHTWELRIQQHKGNDFAYVELLPEQAV